MHVVTAIVQKHPTLLALLGLLVICVLFFYQPLFSGEIVNATDILGQQYFWNGFIKENLFTDPCFQTWLPYINAGTPFSGGLDLIFRPVMLLTLLFLPVQVAINYEMIICFFLGGVFMYGYMRELKVSALSAFLAALFLMLNGEIVTLLNAGHVSKIGAIAFAPLVFWAFERALRRKTLAAFLLTGVALSFQFWQGHIQISFYTCLAVGLYYLIRMGMLYWQERALQPITKLTVYALLMVIVFLLLAAVNFLPLLSFAQVSERAQGMDYESATNWSMPPEELITYAIPGFFGLRRLNHFEHAQILPYWGRMPFTQTGRYFGILPLLLAALAVCFVRKQHVLTLTVLAGFVLVMGMGRYIPTYRLLYEYAPGFNKFRVPQMILFLFAFAASGLAGFGANWLFAHFSEHKEKRLRLFLLAGIAIFLCSWLLTLLLPQISEFLMTHFKAALLRNGGTPEIAAARLKNIFYGLVQFSVLLGIALFILGLRLAKQLRRGWLVAALILMYLIDIWLFNSKYIDTIPFENSFYINENDAIRYCKAHPGLYRILQLTDTPESYAIANKYVSYHLFSVSGYEAVGVQYYNEYLENMALGTALVDLLNIRYLILPKNVQVNEQKIEVGKMIGPYKVVQDADAVLLENLNWLPRVFPVHAVSVQKNRDEIFATLLNPKFNPAEMVLLEEPPNVPFTPENVPAAQSTAEITAYLNRTIQIKATMAADGFLVLSEKYYPGWRAYVDGQPARIYKADYTLQAIFLPKGEHTVSFAYQPKQFLLGLIITTLMGLGLLVFWVINRKFQPPPGSKLQARPTGLFSKVRSLYHSKKVLLGRILRMLVMLIAGIAIVALLKISAGGFTYLLLTAGCACVILGLRELHDVIGRLWGWHLKLACYLNILLAVCSVMVVLTLFEIFLQINHRQSSANQPDSLTMPEAWKLREVTVAGAKYAKYWQGKLHVYDETGFRRITPFAPKQAERCRIIVVGDSLTYGAGVANNEVYPQVIEAELAKQYRVEVLNLGLGGFQSEEILGVVIKYASLLQPDLIVYGMCQNDFLEAGEGQRSREQRQAWPFPLPEQFKQFMVQRTLSGAFFEKSYDDLLMRLGLRADFYSNILHNFYSYQLRFTRDVAVMNYFATQHGFPPIVAMVLDQVPILNGRGQQVTRVAEAILKLVGMQVVSTEEYYQKYNGRVMHVSRWEGHPSAEAHRLFAEYFVRALKEHPVLQRYKNNL